MSNKIDRRDLDERFWETKPMNTFNLQEWEALCDGCGKCCLNKLEDEDTGKVDLTRIACRLLDDSSCMCSNYAKRHDFVPECIVMTPTTIEQHMYWLPQTCAYRLVYEGRPLFDWHPLISGDPETVHRAQVSMRDMTVPETKIPEEDWDDYIIQEPT